MRAALIGILALLCGGCAAPAFDLVSRDPESPWLAGQHWVRTESSRATVNASYDRTWLDHLIFEVEVVNQSDAPLVVDPSQFTFTLASSAGKLPRPLSQHFAAEDPHRVRTQLERATPDGGGFGALMFAGAIAVVTLAVLAGDLDPIPPAEAVGQNAGFSNESTTSQASAAEPDLQQAPDDRATATTFERDRQRSLRELLQRTVLAPGQSLCGEVWLPAKPLRRMLGAESSGHGHGITATPAPAPSDYALTLRTPDALGGQEVEYSVATW
jgi:hypothetical protein